MMQTPRSACAVNGLSAADANVIGRVNVSVSLYTN